MNLLPFESNIFNKITYHLTEFTLNGGFYNKSSLEEYEKIKCKFRQQKGLFDKEVVLKDTAEEVYCCWDVAVIYPDKYTEFYVEPLPRIRKEFFDEVSNFLWKKYDTFYKGGTLRLNRKNMDLRSQLHTVAARFFWDNSEKYKEMETPNDWIEFLNKFIDVLKNTKIKTKWDITVLEEKMSQLVENTN